MIPIITAIGNAIANNARIPKIPRLIYKTPLSGDGFIKIYLILTLNKGDNNVISNL